MIRQSEMDEKHRTFGFGPMSQVSGFPGQDLTLPAGPRAKPIGDNEASAPLNSHGPLEQAASLVQLSWRYSARVRDTIPDGPTTLYS